MFREGIQSVDLSKIRCNAEDKKKSGVDKENKVSDVYQNKSSISQKSSISSTERALINIELESVAY